MIANLTSESEESPQDAIIRYLEEVNAIQAQTINYLTEQNKLMLEKILEKKTRPIPVRQDFEPIGKGYIPLRNRIEQAELDSLNEFNKEQEDASKERSTV